MAAIKRTPADAAFSICVRERAGWKCERCRKQHERSSQGLHCSHHHRRGQWAVRFDPANAEALCYGCHSLEGGTQARMDAHMTEAQQELLRERRDDVELAKMYRRTKGKGALAAHFREELKRMQALRESGYPGRIEFEAWL